MRSLHRFGWVPLLPILSLVLAVSRAESAVAAEELNASTSVRILDSQEVDVGDHTITYHRVETPVLKPEPVKLAPAPAEEVPMSAQEEEELRKWEAKFQCSLFLSVAVYDGAFSELRWWGDGQENVVWSNVNFLHFAPFADLDTGEAYYSILLWGWETTAADVRAMNAEARTSEELMPCPPANLPLLAKAGPKWQAASPLSEGAKRVMEDFHEYYRKNGSQMAVDYAKRVEETSAREEWAKAHPPVPQDTVINYFPIRSVQAKSKAAK